MKGSITIFLAFINPKITWGKLLIPQILPVYQYFHGATGSGPLESGGELNSKVELGRLIHFS